MEHNSVMAFGKLAVLGVALSCVSLRCGGSAADPRAKDVEARLARLEQVQMKFDARQLPPRTKRLLQVLIEAGQLVHEAYLHQLSPEGVSLRDSLALLDDELSKNMLRLINRNGGPFDKMDNLKNFFGESAKPQGAGFYPVDLTQEELENHLAMHPHEAAALQNPHTVVRRDGSGLSAVPFHEAYKRWIAPAAELLKEASTLTDNAKLKVFLEQRAQALITDDYYQSNLDWFEVNDADIDFWMAPSRNDDDALMHVRRSYEVSVMVKDSVGSAAMDVYAKYLDVLEQNLPIDNEYKRANVTLLSPVEIVTDVYRGGALATGYQIVAATLPADPNVQNVKGAKKIFWKNLMAGRVDHVILPLGRELFATDQIEYITPQGVFMDALMRELSRSLGPRFVFQTSDTVSVSQALGGQYFAIEEAKADIVGFHSVRYFVEKGIVPKEMEHIHAVSALASIFSTLRFGTSDARGKACISELNYLWKNGAIRVDSNTRKWSIIFERFGPVVSDLAHELLMLEVMGDVVEVEKFFKKWSNTTKEVEESLARLAHLPVDIEPVYSVKWD